MNGLKNYKIMGIAVMLIIGVAFEGLRHFQFTSPRDDLGKAADLYAVARESSVRLEEKNLRRPRAAQMERIQKINAPRGVKFDLKAAISSYQKEHGLEETKDGARKRADQLKAKKKADKKKKKKNSKYEYVFDMKRGRWVKRLKLTDEQKEALLAKKQAELLEKMKKEKKKSTAGNENSVEGSDSWFTANGTPQPPADEETSNNGSDKKQDSLPTTKEAWLDRINPRNLNKTALNELIQAYTANKVTAPVYYGVVDELVNYPDVEVKKAGLFLVDAFPSARSFEFLVQHSGEADSSLLEEINKSMEKSYTTLQGLNALLNVLKVSDNEQVLLAATQQLNLTMEKVLSSGGDTASYASSFRPFVGALQSLIDAGNPAVSPQAASILQLLQSNFNLAIAANDTGF